MNKLLIFLFSLLAVSLEAATITNWGSQLPTAAPVGSDVILMQKGGVTYYFTPNQLAANISTNANSATINSLNGSGTNTAFYGGINAAAFTNLSSLQVAPPFNPTNSGLIADGDSLMGNFFPVLTNSFPYWRRFGAISNFAESGAVMAGLENHWTTNVAPTITVMKNAGLTNIILLFEIGANNLGEATATFAATMRTWSNYVVRAQSSNVTVVAFSILPQTYNEAQRILNWYSGNSFIRLSPLPDYVVDWSRLFPTPNDTTWYTDGIHLTSNGYYRASQLIDATLRGPKHSYPNGFEQNDYNTNRYIVADSTFVGYWNALGLTLSTVQRLSIGGTTAKSPLHVGVASDSYEALFGNSANLFAIDDGTHPQLSIWSTTAAATDKGARVALGGRNTVGGGTTSPYPYVYLIGASEGAAAYNGYFAVRTAQADSDIRERMRITSSGTVGIGTTVPSSSLDVTGQVRSVSAIITNSASLMAKSFSAPASTAFTTSFGAHLWSDGTNLCVVLENSAGGRTTNKLSMTAWP